jgi:NAD(P)-dependent dehydrogenase (short-subunit alcohol dehydrogenase family)
MRVKSHGDEQLPRRGSDAGNGHGIGDISMSDLTGKVALITGAARGQGRSHALRLAQDGADIVAVDLTGQIATIPYPMATRADLDETVGQIRRLGRRVRAETVDVRDLAALRASAAAAISQFGVWNTVVATVPSMLERGTGGSVQTRCRRADATFANAYAKNNIRVNSVHPTGVSTPMVLNDFTAEFVTEHPEAMAMAENLLPVPFIEPEDVSSAAAWLAGDESRYVTGVVLPVDAGFIAK